MASSVARADICAVDLEDLTNDPETQYRLYFGQVGGRTSSSSGPLALCLGRASNEEISEAAPEAELVALADSTARGTCTTADYSHSCGTEGCASLETIVYRKDLVSLGIPEPGLRCLDTRGLLGAAGREVVLGPAQEGRSVAVTDTVDDAVMSMDGILATCSLDADDTLTFYGRGSTWGGWGWVYDGEMYVCSQDDDDDDNYLICTFSAATMESSGLVSIVGNTMDNAITIDYAYSIGITCNDQSYRIHGWDGDWLRGMYLLGDDGDDTLIGSPNNDYLYGNDDDDDLIGAGGNDVLRGYAGNDTLYGDSLGLEDEYVDPGPDGNDTLYGGDNNDALRGEGGADYLQGDSGLDYLNGGTGSSDNCVAGNDSPTTCPSGDCCERPECESWNGCGTQ